MSSYDDTLDASEFDACLALPDTVIQDTLRDIGVEELIAALATATPVLQDVFIRNLPTRARKLIGEQIASAAPTEAEVVAGRVQILKRAKAHLSLECSQPRFPPRPYDNLKQLLAQKPMRQRNAHESIEVLTELAELARLNGLLDLEKVLDELDEPYLSNALSLIMDGTPASVVSERLQERAESVPAEDDQRLRVIETAVLLIQNGETPSVIELRCSDLLAASA